MPGIAVLVTRAPRERAVQQLTRMVGCLCHESFYTTGTWIDEKLGVYIGWTARRNSFCDGMPVRNERGDVTLVFSGEDFPEPGAIEDLRRQGHEFDASGPAYLVHAYEGDSSFPAGLNGRFHGILVDHRKQNAVLFNDRYGMHRLYYHQSKDGFYCATEAKAILAVRPELRSLDTTAAGEFIACGCALEWRSLFEGIAVLPGGSRWEFRNASLIRQETYFKPEEWENQDRFEEPEAYYRELREVFARNLPRHFGGTQPIGMSLTGGLDTRMIMAWQKPTPGTLPCYTFGGARRDCQDVVVAREVARVCGQPHQVIRTGGEFLAQFARYAERTVYLTDGSADASHAPDLYVNELARQIAPVRMTGNYGGEVLRRVRAFGADRSLAAPFATELSSSVAKAATSYANLLQEHPVTFALFKQGPWHHYGPLNVEQSQLGMRSPFLDNDFVRTVFRAPKSTFETTEISWRLVADGNRRLMRIATDRGLGGERGRFAESISHGLLEFLFKAEYAYDMGMPQWLARVDHALAPLHLDRLILGRHKIFHFRIWYRDVLAGYVREMLLDPHTLSRPYLERKRVEAMVRGHLRGNENHTTEIHKVLTLELLHRLFLDNPGTNGMEATSSAARMDRLQALTGFTGESTAPWMTGAGKLGGV